MHNYLELTNDVLRRMNEVPLTAANFSTAEGVHADAKGYVNNALNRINIEQFEWPFNHVRTTQTLTAGVARYNYPPNAKTLAMDSFIIRGNVDLNVQSRRLKVMDYEEYLDKYTDLEVNPVENAGYPQYVARNRDLSYTIIPAPDRDQEVSFEYYNFPSDLVNWDDVPTVPAHFRWVILEGALYHAYTFRGGVEEAAICDQRFVAGLGSMRTLFINRTESVRSTVR